MTTVSQRLTALETTDANTNARILAITPNNLIFAALGAFVKYGCKVTEGTDNTDLILALEGQAAGDTDNLNPDISVTPTRQFEYPNIASLKGGDFVSLDTNATVTQVKQLAFAGCDYVRITTQNIKEAENLKNIKNELRKTGVDIPLIADVHFNSKVAEVAAQYVEKVRINPGNYIGSNIKDSSKRSITKQLIRKNISK